MDEVRVYNRTLTASEVTALYYNEIAPPGNSAKLLTGVTYVYPLGDVSLGVYTNSP